MKISEKWNAGETAEMKGKVTRMEKIDIYPNNEVVHIQPPEPIDEAEPACLVDYLLPRSKNCIFDYGKMRRFGEDNFTMTIGGTTYEISTHFNPKGKQCVMEQFKELILSEKLI